MVQAITPDELLIVAHRPGPKVPNSPHSRILVDLIFCVPKSDELGTITDDVIEATRSTLVIGIS